MFNTFNKISRVSSKINMHMANLNEAVDMANNTMDTLNIVQLRGLLLVQSFFIFFDSLFGTF